MHAEATIIMPVKNAEPTLELAVRSMMAQTFYDWEMELVDDHSADGSSLVARNLAAMDRRIRVWPNPGEGIVDALNFAMAHARGRIFVRMDADDIAAPNRLQTQLRFLEMNPGIGAVGSVVAYLGDRQSNEGYARYVDWTNTLQTPDDIAQYRFVESPLAHPSMCFRRELIEIHGGYRHGQFPEDYELWLRWLDAGVRIGKCPETLLHWRDSMRRLSRQDSRYDVREFYAIKAHYLHRWIERHFAGRPVWIWGAGRTTRQRVKLLQKLGVEVAAFIDIDPDKIGQRIEGIPVVSPDNIPPPGEALILIYVGARGAREQIETELTARGHQLGQDYIPAA